VTHATVWLGREVVGGRKKDDSHGDGETGRRKKGSLSEFRLRGGVLDCFAALAMTDFIMAYRGLSASINEVFLLLFVHKKKIFSTGFA
jgi:hypothetical protein